MKTVVIFDQCGITDLRFYVVDGDHSYANGAYVNMDGCDDKSAEFINTLDNNYSNEFPIDVVKNEDCVVIVCGFIP